MRGPNKTQPVSPVETKRPHRQESLRTLSYIAEGVGFEPTGTKVPRLFKSRAFVRSAIPPDSSAGLFRQQELGAILPDLRA
jgi:hypothetical protein